jgi:hypothetical protein
MELGGKYLSMKWPFLCLGAYNFCNIYDVRTSDCSRFPCTDEDVLLKRPLITLKNSSFCPITYYVLEKLMQVK